MNEVNKLVIITGATKGLGLAITRQCLNSGLRVLGAARSTSEAFEALCGEFPDQVFFKSLDLAKTKELHQWVRDVEKTHGSIYGLINNAALGHDGVLATMHESDIEELITINLTGTIILTKYAVRSMLIKREGRVVNIASIIATTGFNGLSVYGATKSALLGFTRSLAREVGRAMITVNSVSPGYMETEMTAGISDSNLARIKKRSPLNRLVSLEEVANVVDLLITDRGSGMTGVDIVVDAGSTI